MGKYQLSPSEPKTIRGSNTAAHPSQQQYSCSKCPTKQFKWQSSLYKHMRNYHAAYCCRHCGHGYTSRHSYLIHESTCGKQSGTPSSSNDLSGDTEEPRVNYLPIRSTTASLLATHFSRYVGTVPLAVAAPSNSQQSYTYTPYHQSEHKIVHTLIDPHNTANFAHSGLPYIGDFGYENLYSPQSTIFSSDPQTVPSYSNLTIQPSSTLDNLSPQAPQYPAGPDSRFSSILPMQSNFIFDPNQYTPSAVYSNPSQDSNLTSSKACCSVSHFPPT